MKMCKETCIFLEHPEDSDTRGGLIVSGLNGGAGDRPENQDEEHGWQSETFLLPYEKCDNDPFKSGVVSWFRSWGYELSPNSELDRAILPTNIFYNTTHRISKNAFEPDQWTLAVKRLFQRRKNCLR